MLPHGLRHPLLSIPPHGLSSSPALALPVEEIRAAPGLSVRADRDAFKFSLRDGHALIRLLTFVPRRIPRRRRMEQIPLPALGQIDRERAHQQRPQDVVHELHHGRGEAVAVDVGARDEPGEDVQEADGGVDGREVLHAQGGHGDGVPGAAQHRVRALQVQVLPVDARLEAAAEDADDAARAGVVWGFEEREEVLDEAHAGIVAQGEEAVESFVSFWICAAWSQM